jgi:cell division protein FtsB
MSTAPSRVRRVAKTSKVPHLAVARRQSRPMIKRGTSRRLAPAVIVCAIILAAAVVAVLLSHVVLAQSAFRLDQLRDRTNVALQRHEEFLYKVGRLESPARIERYARQELGMVDPNRIEYVVADVGKRIAEPFRRARGDRGDMSGAASAAGLVEKDSP